MLRQGALIITEGERSVWELNGGRCQHARCRNTLRLGLGRQPSVSVIYLFLPPAHQHLPARTLSLLYCACEVVPDSLRLMSNLTSLYRAPCERHWECGGVDLAVESSETFITLFQLRYGEHLCTMCSFLKVHHVPL